MTDKQLSIEPPLLDFGDVQVGGIAAHKFVLTNHKSTPLTFHLQANPSGNGADFNITDLSHNVLQPFECKNLTVAFSPVARGRRQHSWALRSVDHSGRLAEQTIALIGRGTPAVRHSFRAVALPPQDGGKEGFHYVLTISNANYLRSLEAQAGCPLNWYAAVSSGTRRGAVSPTEHRKPGEVFLASEVSSLEKVSVLNCFDIQSVCNHWFTRVHHTITEQNVLEDIDEAIRHTTTTVPQQAKLHSRHRLDWRKVKNHIISSPDAGDIMEINTHAGSTLCIVISSRIMNAYYRTCLAGGRIALVVTAESAELEDKTTTYGVRTTSIPSRGELWVACYTPTLRYIESRLPKREVRFLGCRLSPKDLDAVLERVGLYLGVES